MRILPAATLGLGGCLSQLVPDPPGNVGLPGECTSTAGLSQEVPDGPPPIAGGTLLALPDNRTVVASDPDNDRIWIADTGGNATTRAIVLGGHDEPGRLALDGAGRVHVVLRRGGAILTIDP